MVLFDGSLALFSSSIFVHAKGVRLALTICNCLNKKIQSVKKNLVYEN